MKLDYSEGQNIRSVYYRGQLLHQGLSIDFDNNDMTNPLKNILMN